MADHATERGHAMLALLRAIKTCAESSDRHIVGESPSIAEKAASSAESLAKAYAALVEADRALAPPSAH